MEVRVEALHMTDVQKGIKYILEMTIPIKNKYSSTFVLINSPSIMACYIGVRTETMSETNPTKECVASKANSF